MENDRIFERYSTGKWLKLSLYLVDIISIQAETGDEVQFARVLSYYGITHLFLADQHVLSTIHKQIYDEYIRKPEDVRVRALFSRFLTLYLPDREAAVELAVRALRKIACFYREKKDYSLAEETYLQLLSLEPLHEELYEESIGYLIMTNRKSEAHQCYLSFKRELERELGVLPSFAFGS